MIDPNCLHCVLSQPIRDFAESHSAHPPVQSFAQILQIGADFAASAVPEAEHEALLRDAPKLLERLLRESFKGAEGYQRRRQ